MSQIEFEVTAAFIQAQGGLALRTVDEIEAARLNTQVAPQQDAQPTAPRDESVPVHRKMKPLRPLAFRGREMRFKRFECRRGRSQRNGPDLNLRLLPGLPDR